MTPQERELELLISRLAAGRFAAGKGGGSDQEAQGTEPPPSEEASPAQLLLRGFGLLSRREYGAGLPLLRNALTQLLERPESPLFGLACQAAIELADDEALQRISEAWVTRARASQNRAALASSLRYRAGAHEIIVGRLEAAATSLTLAHELEPAGNSGQAGTLLGVLLIAAWRGNDLVVRAQIDECIRLATDEEQGAALNAAHYVLAVLENSLGNYEAARRAAEQACGHGWFAVSSLALPELVEAATRSAAPELAADAAARLADRARASRTDWSLGMHYRAQALIVQSDLAEQLFQRSIRHLRRTTVVPQLARTQLLYAEWLRRHRRRGAARHQFDEAHAAFTAIGAKAFARRAHDEALATARQQTFSASLTARESQVARLVATGQTNHEIGAGLFISPRTVEYHLRSIFRKLELSTRTQLAGYVVRHNSDP